MLTKDENLSFLQKKINEIKIARFKTGIDPGFQLPDNIISTLRTDDEGYIWFFSSCKGGHAKNIDKDFYASLEYYQKGSAYHICLGGKATVIHDESISHFSKTKASSNNQILIRFKMMKAEYFESRSLHTSSLKTRIRDFFSDIFFSQHYRRFDFPEPAI
ncbi:MAG: pyridoxamine 5'-phosphate oxidase family protein [Ferruginibacter sp.]